MQDILVHITIPQADAVCYFWETSNHGGQGSYCRPRSEQDKFSRTTVEFDHAMRWCSVELISWSLKWKQIYLLVSEGVRSWPCWGKFVLVPAMMRVTFDNYHSIVVLMSIIGEGITSLKYVGKLNKEYPSCKEALFEQATFYDSECFACIPMDTICAYSDIGGSGHVIHWCKLLGQSKILFFMLFLPGPFCCIRLQSTTDSSQVERVEGLPSGSTTKILLDIFSEVMSSWSYSILGAKPGMLTRYKFSCVLNCSGAELLHDRYIQVWVKFLFVGQLISVCL